MCATFTGSGTLMSAVEVFLDGVSSGSPGAGREMSTNGVMDRIQLGSNTTTHTNSDIAHFAYYASVLSGSQITELQTKQPDAITGATPVIYCPFIADALNDGSGGATYNFTLSGATIDSTNDATLPALSGPSAPIITGPSGAAGAASSTANVAEYATTGPTFTTSIALGVGYPTLTGTDASLWVLTALSSTIWRIDPNPAKLFASPTDAGANNVHDLVFNASATVSQSCAITITDVTEPVATLAGALDTITGAVVAGAAAIIADFNGALDGITGAVLAGGTTGRLTSALPLRDAARVALANRSDVAVHVLGKPGLASVMALNAQSIASGIWTAAGPFTIGQRYNVMYEVGGEPIGCEIITAAAP